MQTKNKKIELLYILLIFCFYGLYYCRNYCFLADADSAFRFLLGQKSIIEIIRHTTSGGPVISLIYKITGLSLLSYQTLQFILCTIGAISLTLIYLIFYKTTNQKFFSFAATLIVEINTKIIDFSIQANMYGMLILLCLGLLYYILFFEIKPKFLFIFFILIFYTHYTFIIFIPVIFLYGLYLIYKKKGKVYDLLLLTIIIPGFLQLLQFNYLMKNSILYRDYHRNNLISFEAITDLVMLLTEIFRFSIINSYYFNRLLILIPLVVITTILIINRKKITIIEKKLLYIIIIFLSNIIIFQLATTNNLKIRFIYFFIIYLNIFWLTILNKAKNTVKILLLIYISVLLFINSHHTGILTKKYSYCSNLNMYLNNYNDYYFVSNYFNANDIDYIGHLSSYTYLPYQTMSNRKNYLLCSSTDNWEHHSEIIPDDRKIFNEYNSYFKGKKILVFFADYRRNEYYIEKLDRKLSEGSVWRI